MRLNKYFIKSATVHSARAIGLALALTLTACKPQVAEEAQDEAAFREEHLPLLVKIGGMGQGDAILLNPREVTPDGEMEAWLLSFKVFAKRYRSFAELMQEMAFRDVNDNGRFFVPSEELATAPCTGLLKNAALGHAR